MRSLRLRFCRDSFLMNSISGPFEIHRKNSPSSTNLKNALSSRKDSLFSSNSVEDNESKLFQRKPSSKPQSFQQEEGWSELHHDFQKAKAEKLLPFDELKKLKMGTKKEDSEQSTIRIKQLEREAIKAKESERKMLESLITQTKQLEQTKILLEEAKLEIRNFHGILKESQSDEQIRGLKNELNSALQAEEKSRKAMDDLVFALKEVAAEAAHAKSELAATKSQIIKSESLLQSAAEDMKRKDEEISKLNDAQSVAREEASKLRESLELTRREKCELEGQLSRKNHEGYRGCYKQSLLESKKSSKVSDFESLRLSEEGKDGRKMSRSAKKFSSDRWPGLKPVAGSIAHRHSAEWPSDKDGKKDAIFSSVFDVTDNGLPPFLFAYDEVTNTDDFEHLSGLLFSDKADWEKKTSNSFGEPFQRTFGKS